VRKAFGVLGPVVAWDEAGAPIDLKGPRHRAVLGRLFVARGRVVPLPRLIDDLWDDPPAGAVGAIRSFVYTLRRALESPRDARPAVRLLVTEGPGYALRLPDDSVDAWRFERAVTTAANVSPAEALDRLTESLRWWRGPAYADFADQVWARADRGRLAELHSTAVERQGAARLALGLAADAVPDLDAHVSEHPWREDGWRLLALALYRTGRQGDALSVLSRARRLLAEELGIDPSARLGALETDILRHADHLDPGPQPRTAQLWAQATAAYDRAVASGARARFESTVGLLRSLAVTGGTGLVAAREQRLATIVAAEQVGDAELTGRVIGGYDVPGIWTRSDDPEQAAEIVAAAERVLAGLAPGAHETTRARLLATIAVESRGARDDRGPQAAQAAEKIARRLNDPALLAFALNGVFMQTFHRAGLAAERDDIGREVVALSARHGLATFEIFGHLIRLQARGALADFAGADEHAAAADHLAERHERPLVAVFTTWYRAMRLAATDGPAAEVDAAYRRAATLLAGSGMPGVQRGLLPLALLCRQASRRGPATFPADPDWGPYEPWARPLELLAQQRRHDAAHALRHVPEPPRDLLLEALWCLTARAAVDLGDRPTMRRCLAVLAPAAGEIAGAGSGMLTAGPVSGYLDELAAALAQPG
jgi:DNA-binding SARP family transcriptional activator